MYGDDHDDDDMLTRMMMIQHVICKTSLISYVLAQVVPGKIYELSNGIYK